MSARSLRDDLLGAAAHSPPPERAEEAGFDGPEGYESHLARIRSDPGVYWLGISGSIPWDSAPRGIGAAGDWFPGGRLNLARVCLEGPLDRLGDAEAVLEAPATGAGEGVVLSRSDLSSAVAALAGRFAEWGLDPGARVLLAMSRGADLVAACLACMRLGLVAVPASPRTGDPGWIERRAAMAGCRALVLGRRDSIGAGDLPAGLGSLATAVVEPGWERGEASGAPAHVPVEAMSPALVLSDLSGRVYSIPAAGLAVQAISASRSVLWCGGGALWVQTPSHHASFHAAVLGVLADGGRVMVPPAGSFDAVEDLAGALASFAPRAALVRFEAQPTLEGAAPAGPAAAGRTEVIMLEGAGVTPRLHSFARLGLLGEGGHVTNVLARPETGGFVAGPHPAVSPARPACLELPAPGMDLLVVDERRKRCPPGYGGLVALSRVTPGAALEIQLEEAPIAIGVRARTDAGCELWSMGEIPLAAPYPDEIPVPEIEAVVAEIDGVERVAVVRFEDQGGARRCKAFVVASGGAGIVDAVRTGLSERFGGASPLDEVQVVDDLPVTRSGKVLRSVLKRVAMGDVAGARELEPLTDAGLIERLLLGRDSD